MLFIDSIYQADSCIIVIHHNIDGTFDSCMIVIHHNIDGTFEIATFDYIGLEFEELIIIMTLNHANNEKFSHHYFFSVWNLVLIRFVITFLFRVMHKALKKNVQIGEITIENVFSLSKAKAKNLYSQINHTLQWYREATYKNTTQHIHDK